MRKVSIGVFGGIGLLLVFVFLMSGMDGFGVLGTGVVFLFAAACIVFRLPPSTVFAAVGVPMVVAGVVFVSSISTTVSYDFGTGRSSTDTDMSGLAVGVPLLVLGLILMLGSRLLKRGHVGWPANLGNGLQSRLGSIPLANSAPAAADVVGVVHAPVSPQRLHDAVLAGAESLSGTGIVVLEDRPGLIRMGRARLGGPVEFAVHVEVAGLPTGSQARILVAFTQPSPVPGPGVIGGHELDRLLVRIREELGAVSPASQWS